MIQAKVFELRDKGTFIPIIAILVDPGQYTNPCSQERWLLRRCGYPENQVNVILVNARGESGGKAANGTCNPHDWADRTYQTAHNYIIDHWETLQEGQVICVEHILGERSAPKMSEASNELI